MSLGRTWRFVAARATNTFGRQIINTTVGWELWNRTHDKLVLAMIGVVQVLPVIVLAPTAGLIVDRLDRRRLATLAAFGTGSVGVGLAVASASAAPVWVFLALLVINGCVVALHAPATSSLLANITPRESLERANRMLSSLSEIAQISGPALAGLALVAIDARYVFGFVALTACASAALYTSLGHVPRPPAAGEGAWPPGGKSPPGNDWWLGLRFIFRSPLLLSALTLDMFAVLFAGVTALLPAIATDILGVDSFGYGILRAAQPIGAVSMALLGGRLPPWQRPGRVLLIVVALFGLATMGVGLSTWLPGTALCLIACGALDNISVVIRLTLEQLVVPDSIRGRVSAVHNVFIGMSNELGAAESGVAAAVFGIAPAIVGGGAISIVVVGVVVVVWPQLARMPPLSQLRPPE